MKSRTNYGETAPYIAELCAGGGGGLASFLLHKHISMAF